MSTILRPLPPLADDYVVEVCAACKRRSCLLECHRCDARKGGDPGTTTFTVFDLRSVGAKEHHSYWRSQPGENFDMPRGVDDLRELAEHQRKSAVEKATAGWTLDQQGALFAGYVTEAELGIHRGQARNIIRDVYPEAAAAIELHLGSRCCGECAALIRGIESFGKAGVGICSVCDRRASTAHVSTEDRDRLIEVYVARNGGASS